MDFLDFPKFLVESGCVSHREGRQHALHDVDPQGSGTQRADLCADRALGLCRTPATESGTFNALQVERTRGRNAFHTDLAFKISTLNALKVSQAA